MSEYEYSLMAKEPMAIAKLGKWEFSLAEAIDMLIGSVTGQCDPLGVDLEVALVRALSNRLEQWGTCKNAYEAAWLNLVMVTKATALEYLSGEAR